MARIEMGYNLKTFGERFHALCLYLEKIVENLLWFALFAKIHFIYSSWCSRSILCVSEGFFTDNDFSNVLTKREQNPRNTAPLI